MARRPMTPARRKRRTIRMAIALPILLAVLVLVLDYPILTAGQALRATQKRYFFGPGEVLTSIDFSRGYNKFKIGQSDRYYILRWGDWYAWCSVNHYGLSSGKAALWMPWRTTRLCPWYPWWLATGQKARCWWCATTRTSPGWKSSSPYLLTAAAISWPPLSRISTQRTAS